MSSTANSSSTFRSILDAALADYAKQTGIDLATHPSSQILQNCNSADVILDLLGDKAKQFQAYRDGNRKLINCLKPVVHVLHAVSGILGEAAAMVPFQPTKAILVGIDVLLTTAIGISASYDALVDLLECVGNFLNRLQIYTEIPFSPSISGVVTKIMVEVLSVLSLVTTQTCVSGPILRMAYPSSQMYIVCSIVNIRKHTCVPCLSSNTPLRPGSLHIPFLQSMY